MTLVDNEVAKCRVAGAAANLPAMLRAVLATLALAPWVLAHAQGMGMDSAAALRFSRSVSIPLNAAGIFDKAEEAWTWTFGREPGAVLRRSDRAAGVLEGTARVPFRSTMLMGREESMGVVTYRVSIHVRAGECRTVVSELTHQGNTTTPRGGIHLGLLTNGAEPPGRVGGMSRATIRRLYAEVKEVGSARVEQLMRSFEARMRSGIGE
jgi:hypothetical protein